LDQEEADLEVEFGGDAKDLLGKEVTIAGRKVKVAAAAAEDDDEQEDGDIEDVEIDGDEDDWDDLTTVGPVTLEKEIAIEVLGDVISNTKSAYLPYFEKTMEVILPLCEHAYEAIRKATVSTLHRAYAALWDVSIEAGQMENWKAGLPLQVQPSAELTKYGEGLDERDTPGVGGRGRSVSATESLYRSYMMKRFCYPAHFDTPKV
jgi:importin-4